MDPQPGSIFRGKHKDNADDFVRVLAVDEAHVCLQTKSSGRRRWGSVEHLLGRYQPHEGPVDFPEAAGPLPPRKASAEPAAPIPAQIPLPAPARVEVVLSGEPAETLLWLVAHYNQALRGTGGRVTAATLLEDLIERDATAAQRKEAP